MSRRVPEQDLQAIVALVARHPGGVTAPEIAAGLREQIPLRTFQYRLKLLVDSGRLARQGTGRWARYRSPPVAVDDAGAVGPARLEEPAAVPLSAAGEEIRTCVRRPVAARTPVGFNRVFLDAYHPNESHYLSVAERAHLAQVGSPPFATRVAGTYARQLLGRLLVDLSWNSSRLEGNTYSLLDTRRLIEFGKQAEGRDSVEAQMVLNHKDAIEFLVNSASGIGLNRYTILNLHGMLANNLLPDEAAAGRLRRMPVGIAHSTFHPLEVPQLVEECFDQLLATAAAVADPFEQAFFVMAQLPYLQPFEDVNKRVSRLAANIPFIKANLSPLSFIGVPRSIYTEAMLGVYELNNVALLKDIFIWAYERSAASYAAVRQSLGEPDPFRLKYRDALRELVVEVVRAGMKRQAAAAHVAAWSRDNILAPDRERFREIAETELLSLHEGNFARYRLRPAEFTAWREQWAAVEK